MYMKTARKLKKGDKIEILKTGLACAGVSVGDIEEVKEVTDFKITTVRGWGFPIRLCAKYLKQVKKRMKKDAKEN